MPEPIILASGSQIRATLLSNAAVRFDIRIAKIDEQSLKAALIEEETSPRDIADALAEAKARKVSGSHPDAFVIGCDQTLAFRNELLSKPTSQSEAVEDLLRMSGQTHYLYSSAVIYHETQPIWRTIGQVRMHMRKADPEFLKAYVARNWSSIQESVGGYKLEEEGVRLFDRVEGDYFHVLGLPLLEILGFLTLRGVIDG